MFTFDRSCVSEWVSDDGSNQIYCGRNQPTNRPYVGQNICRIAPESAKDTNDRKLIIFTKTDTMVLILFAWVDSNHNFYIFTSHMSPLFGSLRLAVTRRGAASLAQRTLGAGAQTPITHWRNNHISKPWKRTNLKRLCKRSLWRKLQFQTAGNCALALPPLWLAVDDDYHVVVITSSLGEWSLSHTHTLTHTNLRIQTWGTLPSWQKH